MTFMYLMNKRYIDIDDRDIDKDIDDIYRERYRYFNASVLMLKIPYAHAIYFMALP